MSKVFDSLEQEIFETFLIKEREQREIEKKSCTTNSNVLVKMFKGRRTKSNNIYKN